MKETNIIKEIYKKHKIKRYLSLILGILICAVSFNLFIYPNNIVFGGVSGISIIVTKYFSINASTFIFISSFILLIVSYIFLGKEKTKGSVVGSILLPLFIRFTENIGKVLVIDASDQLLLAIVGGVLYGFGAGLVFKAGFTTGGTDILNQIMNKYAKVSIGTSMLIIDGLIVLSGGFVFGWTKFMYAIIVLYIISILTDKVLLGISSSKAFYIVTSKQEEISDYVINELGHSVTIFDAKGGYTKTKNPVLFTVIPTKEYYKLKAGINEIDKNAFFTVVDAYEVLGGE